MEKTYLCSEIAQILKICSTTSYKLLRHGYIKAEKSGNRFWVSEKDFYDFLVENSINLKTSDIKIENLNLRTTQEIAKMLFFSQIRINQLVSEGIIGSIKIGKQYRIPQSEIERFLANEKRKGMFTNRAVRKVADSL